MMNFPIAANNWQVRLPRRVCHQHERCSCCFNHRVDLPWAKMKLFGLRNFIKDKCLISLKVLEMSGICLAFLVPQGLTATYWRAGTKNWCIHLWVRNRARCNIIEIKRNGVCPRSPPELKGHSLHKMSRMVHLVCVRSEGANNCDSLRTFSEATKTFLKCNLCLKVWVFIKVPFARSLKIQLYMC